MGGDALQIAAAQQAVTAIAYLMNITDWFLCARQAYPDGCQVAGIGVTSHGRATDSIRYQS